MSSTYVDPPGSDEPTGSVDVAAPKEHHWFQVPTKEVGPAGQPGAVLEPEPELLSVIGTMPMSTLASFGGVSLPQDRLDEITQAWRQGAASAPGSEPRS